MRQYPDIRVGRQETGSKKKTKSNEILLKMSVGVSWEKNFLSATVPAEKNFLQKED